MTNITVYHGTPYLFDVLRTGSWVAMTKEEAALHLFMKNIQSETVDRVSGWIITIPNFNPDQCSIKSDLSDTERNYMTVSEIAVDPTNRESLKDAFYTLDIGIQRVLNATEIFDLTEVLVNR